MTQLTDNVARIAEHVGKLGWYVWDRETSDVDWSPGLRELFRLPDEVPGTFETYVAMVHDEDREAALQRGAAAIKDGTAFDSDYRIVRWDGTIMHVHARGEALEVDGRPVIVGVVVDVTENAERKLELQRVNDRLVDALQRSQDLISLMEANGLVL